MNLTREEAIKKHREMWNWIADETLKRDKVVTKEDYFDEFYSLLPFSNRPAQNCWCCEYASRQIDGSLGVIRCNNCPIKFNKSCCLPDGNNPSLYSLWRIACSNSDYELAAKYAREIANLPERVIGMKKPEIELEDKLYIAFDRSNYDYCVMSVARKNIDKVNSFNILKMYEEEEARTLYDILIGNKTLKEVINERGGQWDYYIM